MIALQNRQLRFGLAPLVIVGSLLVADVPAGGTEEPSSVPVVAEVVDTSSTPPCQDEANDGLSFQPELEEDLLFQLPEPMTEFAVIDLNIEDGKAPDCTQTTGRVTFTNSGFKDSNDQVVSFLEITGANCIYGFAGFIFPSNGVYTCGNSGFSSGTTPYASPSAIGLVVTPGQNMVPGTYTNTVSINLIANP